MPDPLIILQDLGRAGVRLLLADGRLRYQAAEGAYTPQLRDLVAANRGPLVELLARADQVLADARQRLAAFRTAHAREPGQLRALDALGAAFDRLAERGDPLLFTEAAALDGLLELLAEQWRPGRPQLGGAS
jgi:hypothetical protein